ncbi:hypothetical protein C8R47DRAFT_1085119 [Mycena vitilis]|nr:hypothetical protein C8R47DRAFT_1085119 [Mycena vitilis]
MSFASTASAEAGPMGRDSHVDDFFTARSASSSTDSSSSASDTGHLEAAAGDSSPQTRQHGLLDATSSGSASLSLDCRSTLHSPRLRPQDDDDSDSDSPPPLRPISPEEGEIRDESQSYVDYFSPTKPANNQNSLILHSRDPVTPVVKAEVDGYLVRIGRAPPSPSNQSWVINQDWTKRRDLFLQNLQSAENSDALAGIRQVKRFLEQTPAILDRVRMEANKFIDTDFVDQLQHPAATAAGCKEFAARMQSAQDARDAYSPGLLEASRAIHNITHIAVSQDGKRLRQLSD